MGKPMTLVADMPWSLPFSSTGTRVQLSDLQNVSPDGWIINGQIKFWGSSRETQWQASCRISMPAGKWSVFSLARWWSVFLFLFLPPNGWWSVFLFLFLLPAANANGWWSVFFLGPLVICMNTWRPTRAPEANSVQSAASRSHKSFFQNWQRRIFLTQAADL